MVNKIQIYSKPFSGNYFNKKNLMVFYINRWYQMYEDIDDFIITDGKVTVDLIVRI